MVHKTEQEKIQLIKELKLSLSNNSEIPENQLVQFLEANIWDINDAKQQLLDTVEWREKTDADHLPVATKYNKLPTLVACRGYKYINDVNFSVQPELSESTIRITNCTGGNSFHKFDKDGHPILIDRTGYHNTKEMGNNVTTEEITNYQIAANEFLNRVIFPESSEIAGKPIHSETVIFDCTNMSLWQFHMNAMYHLKAIAEIVQHYYPETLHRLFIINAPSAFVVMFKVIKPWLNTRTLDKIHVLGKGYEQVLLQYIDEQNLPHFLGGTCTCSHMPGGCVPLHKDHKFIPTSQNEKVATVYNTHIMNDALSNDMLCTIASTTITTTSSSTITTVTSDTSSLLSKQSSHISTLNNKNVQQTLAGE